MSNTVSSLDQEGRLGPSIKYLQRSELDDQGLAIPSGEVKEALRTAYPLNTPLPIWLVRLGGLSRPLKQEGQREEKSYVTREVLAGLNGQNISLYFLVRGMSTRVNIHFGTLGEGGPAIRGVFRSQYPGLELLPDQDDPPSLKQAASEVQAIRTFMGSCKHVGVVTGVPTPHPGGSILGETQLDRLLRGMFRSEWAFLVLAEPEDFSAFVPMQLAVLKEYVRVEQEAGLKEWRESPGQSVAMYYSELLKMQMDSLQQCLSEGGWWVQSYICSPDEGTFQRAKALVKSIFSGELSLVDRLRVLDAPGASLKAASFSPILGQRPASPWRVGSSEGSRPSRYHTLLSSGQLSAFIHLPAQETPGYYIRNSIPFDVTSHVPDGEEGVEIGYILDQGGSTGNRYRIPIQELTKHCLLVGITGSGKTNTAKHLILELAKQVPDAPILVIEPAKREYRRLLRVLPSKKPLLVFTVGEEHEAAAPIRLNPFEIRPGVNVQTHIDLLKSVFNASFGMWTPLPQVLERAINEIYRDKGWDPIRGENARGRIGDRGGWHPFAHPTLSDLYEKVGELVPRLGYDKEVERNVRTALETRINSLRIGAKGLMLDTRASIPIESLLAGPTVLELEGVGDDDEKAFIMGLILINLYEYYRSQGMPQKSLLKHVTVIEEAHRLLSGSPQSRDAEATNLKSKAVETFVNMLSEVRAYGEGFIVAEQIPTKLAVDVIKNTGLKIMHRTVAIDDREVMGGAMNLDELQMRQVSCLVRGQAVVHCGGQYGDDFPMLVMIDEVKEGGAAKGVERPDDVRSAWSLFLKSGDPLRQLFQSYKTCSAQCQPEGPGEEGSGRITCLDARQAAEDRSFRDVFSSMVLSLVSGSLELEANELPSQLMDYSKPVHHALSMLSSGTRRERAWSRCLLTHALFHFLSHQGWRYGWKYQEVEGMIDAFLPILLETLKESGWKPSSFKDLGKFCQKYTSLCVMQFDPFPACSQACPAGQDGKGRLCLFRHSVEPLLQTPEFAEAYKDAQADPGKMLNRSYLFANRLSLQGETTPGFRSTTLCFAIQAVTRDQKLDRVSKSNLLDKVFELYPAGEPPRLPKEEEVKRG